MNAVVLLLALLVDRLIGDPEALWKKIPHPVALAGRAVDLMDENWNKNENSPEDRRQKGMILILVLIAAAILIGLIVEKVTHIVPGGWLIEIAIAAILIAHRSLLDHVSAVATALQEQGLAGGRMAVARIVGRDVETLDVSGISRAAIESLAENFSDGVVAPSVFFLVFGLPGLLVYKAVNTADSMIGHRTEKYREFGWCAARTDDVLNWVPARLSALLIAAGAVGRGGSFSAIWRMTRQDAGKHRSPNAGWPEAALAAALQIALGGPRSYEAVPVAGEWLNSDGAKEIGPAEINSAMTMIDYAWYCLLILVGLIVLLMLR